MMKLIFETSRNSKMGRFVLIFALCLWSETHQSVKNQSNLSADVESHEYERLDDLSDWGVTVDLKALQWFLDYNRLSL